MVPKEWNTRCYLHKNVFHFFLYKSPAKCTWLDSPGYVRSGVDQPRAVTGWQLWCLALVHAGRQAARKQDTTCTSDPYKYHCHQALIIWLPLSALHLTSSCSFLPQAPTSCCSALVSLLMPLTFRQWPTFMWNCVLLINIKMITKYTLFLTIWILLCHLSAVWPWSDIVMIWPLLHCHVDFGHTWSGYYFIVILTMAIYDDLAITSLLFWLWLHMNWLLLHCHIDFVYVRWSGHYFIIMLPLAIYDLAITSLLCWLRHTTWSGHYFIAMLTLATHDMTITSLLWWLWPHMIWSLLHCHADFGHTWSDYYFIAMVTLTTHDLAITSLLWWLWLHMIWPLIHCYIDFGYVRWSGHYFIDMLT